MGKALVDVGCTFLGVAFDFPSNITVVGCRMHPTREGMWQLIIETDDIPSVKEGELLPEADIVYERRPCGHGQFKELRQRKQTFQGMPITWVNGSNITPGIIDATGAFRGPDAEGE